MEKIKYKLGIMDLYPIAANKTQIENNPFLQAKLKEPAFELGLESFYNKEEKGIPQKKQEPGFATNALPFIKRGYKTDCHILKLNCKHKKESISNEVLFFFLRSCTQGRTSFEHSSLPMKKDIENVLIL